MRYLSPIRQAAIVLAGAVVAMLLCMASGRLGIHQFEDLTHWSIATAAVLTFAIFNSVISLGADNSLHYWRDSVYSYIGLALASAYAARFISGLPIGEAGSYRWIYFVVSFCFLVFLSMVNFMRRIVRFAEREEWNEPRKKNRE